MPPQPIDGASHGKSTGKAVWCHYHEAWECAYLSQGVLPCHKPIKRKVKPDGSTPNPFCAKHTPARPVQDVPL